VTKIYLAKGYPKEYFRPTTEYIHSVQLDNGAIPWFSGSTMDPWDHVESAMGLTIGGKYAEAEKAFLWLQREQLYDGSWWAGYQHGKLAQGVTRKESNFVAYVATGVWHYYLVTKNKSFLKQMWPCVEKAITFVLNLQTPYGEIYWAVDSIKGVDKDALLTGNSSIYKSLECAINIASTLDVEKHDWFKARQKLGNAILNHPERFDRTWESKSRFSMDWFYPVLSGALRGAKARARLAEKWDVFVEHGLGCRCVSDEPWVTIAESCELVMALLAAGEKQKASELFSWLHEYRDHDGAYWTGWVFRDQAIWPEEKPTWTAGAVLLAADALTEATAASKIFTEVNLLEPFSKYRERGYNEATPE
jgi:hypothetical protein